MERLSPLMVKPPTITTWSTADVPPAQRFDYFSEALSSALIPMRADSRARNLVESHIVSAEFDEVTVIRQTGSAHWSYRDNSEVSRSGAHTFHLVANYTTDWVLSHCGRVRLRPGDAVLTDSMIGHRLEMFSPYDVLHVKLSDTWLQRWLPRPEVLVGKRIPAGAGWGEALTSFIAQLSPRYMIGAPLPSRVITDQLGALLALVGASVEGVVAPVSAQASLRARIKDCIHQSCGDPTLSADAVATALNLDVDELHRILAAAGESFAELLQSTRLDIVVRMLQSKIFRNLTINEIALRAGFATEAHVHEVLRLRSSESAAQLRRNTS